MELKFNVKLEINKPIKEVFHAVINAQQIAQYFVDNTSGDLEEGKTIVWSWKKIRRSSSAG